MKSMRKLVVVLSLLAPIASFANVPEIGWPRAIEAEKGKVVIYQPQLDSLEGDKLIGRAAVSVEPKDSGEPVFGVIRFESRMDTDRDARTMRIVDLNITHVGFADATDEQKDKFETFVEEEILEWDMTLSLDRVLASLAVVEEQREAAEGLKFDPPVILFTDYPSILIMIDGEPRFEAIEGSALERLVNSPFTIVRDGAKGRFYLDGGTTWYAADSAKGPWMADENPPQNVAALRSEEASEAARDAAADADDRVPRIVVATEPTELIVIDGSPQYTPLTIELLGVTNSDSDVLLEIETQRFFVVLSGRWYASKSLDGPWGYVSFEELPESFAGIPPGSIAGHVLAFVPGTEEAEQAILDNQIPQTAAVKRGSGDFTVQYDGEPKFEAIDGTGMQYAVNTSDSVLLIDGKYWVCRQAVWYEGASPAGPWTVATVRPDDVESIPASNPHYNVKYVYVYDSTPDVVYVGYTPGYYGSYYYGGCVVYGTGWYYPSWYGHHYYPYHSTWGFNVGYNPYSGWSVGLSWSSGPFTIGIGYGFGGGYGGYPYHGGGYWGPRYGYHGGGNVNIGNVNIGEVNIGNRGNRGGGADRTRSGRDNIYNRSGNRERLADRPARGTRQPSAVSDRANNVLAGRDGNVYRKSGDSWQRREEGDWKASDRARDRSSSGLGSSGRGNATSGLNRDYGARQRGNQWSSGSGRGGSRGSLSGSRGSGARRGGGRRR
jgi:hypothetical protein